MPVSPRRRARTLGVGALLLGFFVAVVATLAQMFRDGRAHPIAPADVAVVFGAEASERVVSPEALARVERAAELYRAGLVGAIVCSGGLADGASEARSCGACSSSAGFQKTRCSPTTEARTLG